MRPLDHQPPFLPLRAANHEIGLADHLIPVSTSDSLSSGRFFDILHSYIIIADNMVLLIFFAGRLSAITAVLLSSKFDVTGVTYVLDFWEFNCRGW